MPFADSKTAGGKVRVKCSTTAGEAAGASGLVNGELALNSADGVMYFKDATGGVGQFPSASGISRIVQITQAAYDALATKDATTLYVIT